mgnify:FL=1
MNALGGHGVMGFRCNSYEVTACNEHSACVCVAFQQVQTGEGMRPTFEPRGMVISAALGGTERG